jgi:hypothetical protein
VSRSTISRLCLLLVACVVALVSPAAYADPITLVSGSTLTLSAYYDNSGGTPAFLFVDTEGQAGLIVDGAGVLVFDSGAATSTFPDTLLFALNFPSVDEAIYIPLNTLTMQFSADLSSLTILGPAAPFGPLTDPGLLALVNGGPLKLSFSFGQGTVNDNIIVNTYNLTSVTQAPEPASIALLASGLLGGFWRRRRQLKS